MLLPLVTTFDDLLTTWAMQLGADSPLQAIVPVEARMVVGLLGLVGIHAAASGSYMVVWDGAGAMHSLFISWNCIGWQSLVLLGVSLISGLRGRHPVEARIQVIVIGVAGTMLLNLLRVAAVAAIAADDRRHAGHPVPRLRRDAPRHRIPFRVLDVRPALDTRPLRASDDLEDGRMNRWFRLALQTAIGLVLLWLWLRTVSLTDVIGHARVHSWAAGAADDRPVPRDEPHPRSPLAGAAAAAGSGRDGQGVRDELGRRSPQLRAADPLRRRGARVVAVAPASRAGGLGPGHDRHRQGVRPGRRSPSSWRSSRWWR